MRLFVNEGVHVIAYDDVPNAERSQQFSTCYRLDHLKLWNWNY